MKYLLLGAMVFLFACSTIKSAITCPSVCNGGTIPCDNGNNLILVAELSNGVSSRYYPYCVGVDRIHELYINGSKLKMNSKNRFFFHFHKSSSSKRCLC
jgi:hypothetical protein